jgi:hypothetical protein
VNTNASEANGGSVEAARRALAATRPRAETSPEFASWLTRHCVGMVYSSFQAGQLLFFGMDSNGDVIFRTVRMPTVMSIAAFSQAPLYHRSHYTPAEIEQFKQRDLLFAAAFANIVSLMMHSPAHNHLHLRDLVWLVVRPFWSSSLRSWRQCSRALYFHRKSLLPCGRGCPRRWIAGFPRIRTALSASPRRNGNRAIFLDHRRGWTP